LDELHPTSSRLRRRALLAVAVLTIAGAVWGVSQSQRSAADRAFGESRAGQQMLTAMLDQETGLRGFALAREEEFLAPFVAGQGAFDAAVASARRNLEPSERKAFDEQVSTAREWQGLAQGEVARVRAHKNEAVGLADVRVRKAVFDHYRALNARFQQQVDAARRSALARAGLILVAAIIALGILFGGIGYLVIERQAAGERRRRARAHTSRTLQAEFNETMQIMRDEDEAYALVMQHLERSIPQANVVVLARNNSANRLTAATRLAEDSPLGAALADAQPDSCLSVRLARGYRRGQGADPLLVCGICGAAEGEVTCVPSLVSGEVIGSVRCWRTCAISRSRRCARPPTPSPACPISAPARTTSSGCSPRPVGPCRP
jgi:CHASE3 domain sensor protein